MSEYSNSAFIDWQDAFENGAYIPGAADLPAHWASESQALREQWRREGRMARMPGSDLTSSDRKAHPEVWLS